MKGWQKVAIAVALTLVAGVVLAVVALRSLQAPPCTNNVVAESASPDGSLKAVVFARDCGATTGFSTQVAIIPGQEQLPDRPGNVFVADTNHGKAQSGAGGGPEVRVSWETPRSLHVLRSRAARVILESHDVGGVTVTYDTLD